ncbi:hypothetical protein CLD20_02315 [Afifella sp. IM 167]|nr:hypothetical protein [Afifella sp. IM 167]
MYSAKPLTGGTTSFGGDKPAETAASANAAAVEWLPGTDAQAEPAPHTPPPFLLHKNPGTNIAKFPAGGRRDAAGAPKPGLSLIERRRGAVRLSTAIDAFIVAQDREVRRCIIRDLSTNGAQLECEEAMALGGEVVLAVPKANIAITCEIAWRRGTRMGVQFHRGRMTSAQIEELLHL